MALPDETKTWVYIGECSDSQHWWRAEHNGIKHLGVGGRRSKPPGFPTNSIAVGAGGAGKEVAEMCARYDRLLALGWVEVDRNETHVLYEAADSEVDAAIVRRVDGANGGANDPSHMPSADCPNRGAFVLGKRGWLKRLSPTAYTTSMDYIPRDEPTKAPECEEPCAGCGRKPRPDSALCSACFADAKREAARRSKTSTPPAVCCGDDGAREDCAEPATEPRCACGASLVTNKAAFPGTCYDCVVRGDSLATSLKAPPAFPDVSRPLALSEQQQPREWWSCRNGGVRRRR